MAVTEEPRGLTWINNVNMTTFGSLISQACWLIGSVALTVCTCVLLLTPDGPSLDAHGLPNDHAPHRNLGFQLAGILLAAWTGKTIAGVVDAQQKRKASESYVPVIKAEAEGKVVGAAAAASAAAVVKDAATQARLSGMFDPQTGEPIGASAAADALRAARKANGGDAAEGETK